MGQISLYMDDELKMKLEAHANMNNTSASKYVAMILQSHFTKGWPVGYEGLFGSIKDESFQKHEVPDFALDSAREAF